MADNRPPVYTENGKTVYRASSVGMCIRSLWAYRQGMTPAETPEWLLEKYEEGNVAEPIILDWIEKKYGGTVYHRQDNIEIAVGANIIIRGHPDGVFKQPGASSEQVVEVKALSRSMYKKWMKAYMADSIKTEFPYYATQISLYMAHYDLPLLFVVGIKDESGELEKDHNGSIVCEVFTFDRPPYKLREIKVKLIQLQKMGREMPMCDVSIFPCPFYFLHDEADIVMSDDAFLGQMARAYFQALGLEKKAKEDKARAAEYIAKTMDDLGLEGEKVEAHDEQGNKWRITDVIVKPKEIPDPEKIKADGKWDEYKKLTRGSRYPKVTMEEKDGDSSSSSAD